MVSGLRVNVMMRWLSCVLLVAVLSETMPWTLAQRATKRVSSSESSSSAESGKGDLKASSSSNDYGGDDSSKGYEDNKNYIPFQWKVEIIKREYDDYVLPDGVVYRVPSGATPPHRYKGKEPYNVPYYVYKEKDSSHEGNYNTYYDKPKLVETYDTQTLELLMQDWYNNEYWDRKYFGANVPDDHGRHEDGVYYDDGYVMSPPPVANGEGYAASDKRESRHGAKVAATGKDDTGALSTGSPPKFFMRSYNGTQRWRNLDTAPQYHSSTTQYAMNGTMDDSSYRNQQFQPYHANDYDQVEQHPRSARISGSGDSSASTKYASGNSERRRTTTASSAGSRLGFGRGSIAGTPSRRHRPTQATLRDDAGSDTSASLPGKSDPFSKKASMDKLYAYVNRKRTQSNALPKFQNQRRRSDWLERDE